MVRKGGRSAPLHALWNCFDAVLQDLPRTKNSVEGHWHRVVSELIGANHPTIWKFIDALKAEQNMNELKIEHLRTITRSISKNLHRDSLLQKEFKKCLPILDYIRGIGHNLS